MADAKPLGAAPALKQPLLAVFDPLVHALGQAVSRGLRDELDKHS